VTKYSGSDGRPGDVGLSTALTRLHADRATETVVRDVLILFRTHPREWFSTGSVAARTRRPQADVGPVLETLSECFVLDFDGEDARYRYQPDGLLELDISDYLHRVDTTNDRLQTDVAKFRRRFGCE
jgi:hypothetical protein